MAAERNVHAALEKEHVELVQVGTIKRVGTMWLGARSRFGRCMVCGRLSGQRCELIRHDAECIR